MNLALHLSIHAVLGLVAGLIGWLMTKRFWTSLLPAILAGTLIDLDHFIEYWLVFGWSFNLGYFIKGFEYLESAKMRIVFHGWEYVMILLGVYFLVRNRLAKAILLSISLGFFFHLSGDVLINGVSPRAYSIIYRSINDFEIEKMSTPENWEEFLAERDAFIKLKGL